MGEDTGRQMVPLLLLSTLCIQKTCFFFNFKNLRLKCPLLKVSRDKWSFNFSPQLRGHFEIVFLPPYQNSAKEH